MKAKLVTLSACDTGVGPVGEAGVANLVNAFIEAGAVTVVSTLWELEDQITTHLMAQFYAHLARHEPKSRCPPSRKDRTAGTRDYPLITGQASKSLEIRTGSSNCYKTACLDI